jgi:hypothetical protein
MIRVKTGVKAELRNAHAESAVHEGFNRVEIILIDPL